MDFPDLANGYLRISAENRNVWEGNIFSVLEAEDRDKSPVYSYFSAASPVKTVSGQSSNYFLQAAKTWSGVHFYCNEQGRLKELQRNFRGPNSEIHEFCPLRAVSIISVSELINGLQNKKEEVSGIIFLRISYKCGKCEYHLYAPCRCINYPDINLLKDTKSLQPFTGPVLVYRQEHFRIAYVYGDISENGKAHTEFAMKTDFRNPTVIGHKQGFLRNIFLKNLKNIKEACGPDSNYIFAMDEFSDIVKLEKSEIIFYRYIN